MVATELATVIAVRSATGEVTETEDKTAGPGAIACTYRNVFFGCAYGLDFTAA
jgi:hypothetical protein